MKVSIYTTDPNIEGMTPVELPLKDGSSMFMLSDRGDGDTVFDSWDSYVTWASDKALNFGVII